MCEQSKPIEILDLYLNPMQDLSFNLLRIHTYSIYYVIFCIIHIHCHTIIIMILVGHNAKISLMYQGKSNIISYIMYSRKQNIHAQFIIIQEHTCSYLCLGLHNVIVSVMLTNHKLSDTHMNRK